ncbi:phosphomevalonate kinase [Nocardia sp. NBC_01503]|uniref:phosphomevalonate kinase n=1 Tax=Nocardia sp. NBC_01503 TaxID=2975997 RepID=UPI002E7B90ED|nr:phosphomevalonate kinase [Nocardia sp. NBC_01503]WTL29538.1 phosphomevalonate kinase [Nocardia sp. NBC_01503]
MITRSAPGKLYIAGEYAVLAPGYPAVLVAVDRYATVTIGAADPPDATTLHSTLSGGISMRCEWADGRVHRPPTGRDGRGAFDYVLSAVAVVDRLIAERGLHRRHFRLAVTSSLADRDGRKFGLGSSAAVTVATVAALAAFYGLDLTRMQRYRLAMLATTDIAPNTSGGDVAASTWGGWIAYRSPDRRQLSDRVAEHGIVDCLAMPWPGLSIQPLPTPKDLRLHVGWTGHPASTPALIAELRRGGFAAYDDFLPSSATCVDHLITALRHQDSHRILHEIRCAREVLAKLDAATNLGIITPRLETLCASAEAVGAAAKPSGAGGGDCGIALIERDRRDASAELADRWARNGIRALPLNAAARERRL